MRLEPDRRAPIVISVVTFNEGETIARTLDSLIAACRHYGNARIVVSDNHSAEATFSILKRYEAGCAVLRVIRNEDDLGYGRGHNVAIAVSDGEYHAICNPDILVAQDILSRLASFMERHREAGLVTPRFLNPDGSTQFLNKRYPTVLDLFLRRFWPRRLEFLVKRRCDRFEMKDIGYERPYDVPYVSGAFMFCRTQILKSVGGFDPRYFLYFEDTDLGRKIQQAGFRTVYCPEVTLVHGWARSNHRSLRMGLILAVNGVRYFNKWGWKLV